MRGNPDKLKPVRTEREASEKGKNGGIKSGEARRKKKAEKDRLKMLLEITPNLDIFLDNDVNKRSFEMLGIEKKDVPDIETLINLKLIQAALKGDLNSIKYIDERVGKNPQLKLKREGFNHEKRMDNKRMNLDERKHEVNRQRVRGEYNVDVESGLIDDSVGEGDGEGGVE